MSKAFSSRDGTAAFSASLPAVSDMRARESAHRLPFRRVGSTPFPFPRKGASTAGPLRMQPTNKKILLIEDEPRMRRNIQGMLELEGFQALAAGDGIEGLAVAKRELPDLILCDIMMP